MNPKGNINYLRRRITRFFSRIIVSNKFSENQFNQDITQVKKVLIIRPNHRLGNSLLLTPLVKEVMKIFPNCEIHLFLKGNLGNVVFENYKDVTKIIKLPRKPFKNILNYFECWFSILGQNYDVSINANRVSFSGKLAARLSRSKYKFYNVLNRELSHFEDYNHNAKNPVYNLRHVIKNKSNRLNKDISKLDLKLRGYEIDNGYKLLNSMFRENKPVISIFTFATGDKCYDEIWWDKLYSKLKEFERDFNILEILPMENVSKINFTAKSYYSRDIREIASVMYNCKVFIGADSGMMHLAHSSNTKTIGLFSITEPEYYGVYGDQNISINTNLHDHDYILNKVREII